MKPKTLKNSNRKPSKSRKVQGENLGKSEPKTLKTQGSHSSDSREVKHHLSLKFNHIDHQWKVLDEDITMSSGETIKEAINSARIVSDEPIYLHGRVFDG